MSTIMNNDSSHLFERLYTKAFKIFLSEVCLDDDKLTELQNETGYLIDKQTGKTFNELGKMIIEINLDVNNNTIDLDKFKFAKHKFMKSIGFQRAVMSYYQQKNYIAVIKPSSPISMMGKIILHYKPQKTLTMTELLSDINTTKFKLDANTHSDKIQNLMELETNIASDDENIEEFSDYEINEY